jgi:hypothetical protein
MIRKLVALAALVITFAIFEYRFSPPLISRPQAENVAARLLSPAIGSFRIARRWRSPAFHSLEVGASYRDASGVEVSVEILLGEWRPHNGISCWYARGYSLLWQHLRETRIANTSAVFDIALFHDENGIALLASTQCYPSGCRESLAPTSGGFSLRLMSFEPSVTPISILIRELKDPPPETWQAQGARLVESFERFAAQLDLSPLVAPGVAQGASGRVEARRKEGIRHD